MQNLLKLYLFFLADFIGIHYNSMISGLKHILFFCSPYTIWYTKYSSRKGLKIMFRFIIVCIIVIGYLILSIPILLGEWVLGKQNQRKKDISSLRIIQAVFRVILKVTGADITIIGHERVPKDQAVLYIGNHRSYFDILLTYVLCPDTTGYIAKKEMEPIPLLSNWMKYLHCLFLDRKDIKEGLKTILTAVDEIKNGVSICIFPEG